VVGHAFRWFFGMLFGVALAFFVLFLVVFFWVGGTFFRAAPALGEDTALREHFYSGRREAVDKIAIVHIDGVILEGLTGYARRQIDDAAADPHVKAVVLRINSPGGSITASDDLHKRIIELRDGKPLTKTPAKPIVVSMAGLAASGGYYIAVPAQRVLAERTTITGSIGVFAMFPNVAQLARDYGVKMDVIKRGDLKASGSMFQDMTPQERQLWQDMVDHAYTQFLDVVRTGRGDKLKYALDAIIKEETRRIPDKQDGKETTVEYVRRLADGGIFTSDKAKKYGLIDDIGYLDDAVAEARKLASLGDVYKAITYERPFSLMSLVLGGKASEPGFNLGQLAEAAMPRIWYLAPQGGMSGLLAASGMRDHRSELRP
jgi:protease-4